jgi:hypothetical protein
LRQRIIEYQKINKKAMKNVMKVSIVILIAAALFVIASPSQAYFTQPQVYIPYQYVPQYSPYYYPYQFFNYNGYDVASGLTQGNLNLISNFTYIPGPVHQYFYQYYQPTYSPYNYGYNSYNYGW